MKLRQCSKGHYYDEETYGDNCPHCQLLGSSAGTMMMGGGDQKTVPQDKSGKDKTKDLTYAPPILDEEKTTGMVNTEADPVVGWLVCIKGNNLGSDFRLHAGRNFVGRGQSMDVCLLGDPSISRSSHAVIVYDPKSGSYLAQPGESRELFYMNGKVVLESIELHAYDVLELGNSSLLFLPLCGEKFDWNQIIKSEG